MRKGIFTLISLLVMFAFLHQHALAKDDDIVATIGDKKITNADFNRIVGYFVVDKQKAFEKNPQQKEIILRQLIQSIVVSELASKNGFDSKPDVKEQLDVIKMNFLANEYLKREVASKATVSGDDMKAFYDANQADFKTSEMVRARHILIKIDPTAPPQYKEKAKEKADGILKMIKEGDDFAELATELSDDPGSKTKGGDLGFFQRGRMVKQFEDVAFSLKPGEISAVVETQYGYHIIKVEEKKSPSVEPFDTVKEKINQKLLQERMKTKVNEFIDKAMQDAKVELHPEVLLGSEKQ